MDANHTAEQQLQQLIADEWEFHVKEDPLFATDTGDHRYNHRLPAISEDDFERRLEQMDSFRRRLQAIQRAALPAAGQLDYAIFASHLEGESDEIRFRAYRMPISKTDGFHTHFPELHQFIPLDTPSDYENYLARLEALPGYVAGQIEVMRAGMRQGQAPARVTLEGVEAQIRQHLVSAPEQSQFYTPFTQFPKTFEEPQRQRLEQAGLRTIAQAVLPAYRALLGFLEDEYFPVAREEIGANSLPDGRAFYAHRIHYHTSLDLSPEEIHQIGLDEVLRIRQEMEAAILQSGFQGSFADFTDFLHHDPRFYTETPEALLKETAYILKRIDGELPRLFKTLPRTPYGIRPVPDSQAPDTTTAYYYPAAGDGSRAGFYYVNTYDLKSRPLYEIEALSLHEAVPGHHLQFARQQELGELTKFRRFTWFTAYVEGWALYAERLGLEMGFYQDPYSEFGRLSYDMWRACRLVVDTGIHALGWTRQQAIDYIVANTSSTLLNIANEVDRYIAWPGQALAYKIGELKIRQLRARAETTLGARFDLRAFHDVLLGSGSLPLKVLESLVVDWIEAQG